MSISPSGVQETARGTEVRLEIEPSRNETPGHLPRAFGLIKAQAEIFGDPPEGFPQGTSVEHGEDQLEATKVGTFEIEPEWPGIHRPHGKDPLLSAGADRPAPHRGTAKEGAILDNGLALWRVREYREGGHPVVREGHIRFD